MVAEPEVRSLFAERNHPHLILRSSLPPRRRHRERTGGGRSDPNYPQRERHARDLLDQALAIRARHRVRHDVLGVRPENVIVIELHRRVGVEEVERAGLRVIEANDDSAMVAFPDEPEMRAFVERCEAYGGPVPPGQEAAPYERLLDGIRRIRPLATDDVVAPDLRGIGTELLRIDVVGWCPEDDAEAHRRHEELRAILSRAGEVLDSLLNVRAGLSAFRVDVPGDAVLDIADTQRTRSMRRCPRPILGQIAGLRTSAADLPPVAPPVSEAPVLAVVDSGVRGDHPLIAPALLAAEGVAGLPGNDEHGHGTLVASLALYGSLEERLHNRDRLTPVARLVSVRVLDSSASFPDAELWERDLENAILAAVAARARIVVLALGDARNPYRPPQPVAVAAIVDRLARGHDLVIAISTGNTVLSAFPRERGLERSYPEWLLRDSAAGLLPPAMAALALTVGGIVGGHDQGLRPHRDDVHQQAMGAPDHPSAHTRCGPGVEHAVKPELCAPAGTPTFLTGELRVADGIRTTHVVGAAAATEAGRMINTGSGTSFAAPLVAHCAASVWSRYPSLSALGVRALVLAGSEDVRTVVEGDSGVAALRQQRRLTGHGKVGVDRSVSSTDHRAMLLSEREMPVDGVDFYSVPIPGAFFSAHTCVVRVTLAHDPPVRATRLDYLANRMHVFAFRGVDLGEVRRKFDADARSEHGPPDSLAPRQLDLQPSARTSCHSANQCATVEYERPWDSDDYAGTDLVVVVRNTQRWEDAPTQRYPLCLMLETDEGAVPLYGELQLRLEAVAEGVVEIET